MKMEARKNLRASSPNRFKRILILDDEPYNIEALKFIFQAIGLDNH